MLVTPPKDIHVLSDEDLAEYSANLLRLAHQDRQEWQLLYYRPNSPRHAKMHCSTAHVIGCGGGNRSGKTDAALVEAVIQATGIIPDALKGIYPREKFRGPISVRIVCESITTTLAPVILHKLDYQKWSGVDTQGGERGHWGWIPKACLLDEDWDRSWREAKRQLTVLCRDPDDPDIVLGQSVFQFMSFDQKDQKHRSGEFHLVLMDEPPPYEIFRESRARVMSVGGRLILSMTWPDDPTIPVDWIFDEVYDPGSPGPEKNPDIDWIEFVTTDNPNIDQESIARTAASMSAEERACRIGGQPIRFANRVHPVFTDHEAWWCFTCHAETLPGSKGGCRLCLGDDLVIYTHVQDWTPESRWPTVFLLDPHPRKPHMMQWVQVNGQDDYDVVLCAELPDTPDEVAKMVKKLEAQHKLTVAKRLMDPNMGASPSGVRREMTWQTEFAEVGLVCDLANDSAVGRTRLNEYLKPDPHTRRPRIRWHQHGAAPAINQMKRFVWDDYKHKDTRDQKQVPKAMYDDYPALGRYLMNELPLCRALSYGAPVLKPRGQRRRGY